jgi:hypothetical protein
MGELCAFIGSKNLRRMWLLSRALDKSHARRYFVDAVKLNKQDAASIRAVELINKLFAIDAQARNEKMNHGARHGGVWGAMEQISEESHICSYG